MNIYIAGKVTARERLKPVRAAIQEFGFECPSGWIDLGVNYPSDFATRVMPTTWEDEKYRDLREIRECDLVIVDTIDESNTGGREFEIGYCTGLGKLFWRVGPKRHLFHTLADKVFENWQDCLEVLLVDYNEGCERA